MPWRGLALLLSLMIAVLLGPLSAPARAQTSVAPLTDEFNGPFASWGNVRTLYGAVGDGAADDTAALQTALNEVGRSGKPGVVYLPAGTYTITATLTLTGKDGVGVIGEDPATTTVRWAGPAGGDMLTLVSNQYSRLARITWDGAGIAGAGVAHASAPRGTGFFASGNSHTDEVFENLGFGIRAGSGKSGDAETAVVRCTFRNLTNAGLKTYNFNALDWWVWDSTFQNVGIGVTNTKAGETRNGAGNFSVYNSRFFGSTVADISIGNTGGFGFRGNWSSGSNQFFNAGPIGSASARVTMQGNTVLRTRGIPVAMFDPGPLVLLDNVLDGAAGGPLVRVKQAYAPAPDANVVAIGNTVTAASPYDVQGQLLDLDTSVADPGSLATAVPEGVPTAAGVSRPVTDVAPGSDALTIQQAIDAATANVGQRPIVHLPTGTYDVRSTLTLPPNSDVQLVGDGDTTILHWAGQGYGPMVRIAGPSFATVRDLKLMGNRNVDGIVIDHVDQPGARVVVDGGLIDSASAVAILSDGLDQAVEWLRNFGYGNSQLGVQVIGGPLAQAGTPSTGRMTIIGAASGGNQHTYEVDNGGRLVAEDAWYEGGAPGFLTLNSSGSFAMSDGQIAAADVDHGGKAGGEPAVVLNNNAGPVLLQGVAFAVGNHIVVQGAGPQSQILVLGSAGTADNWLLNNSPQAQVVLLSSRQQTPGGGSQAFGDQIKQVGSVQDFVRGLLAPVRSEPVQPPIAVAGASDVRVSKVFIQTARTGLHVTP